MDALAQKKSAEATQLISEAEKSLKTSFFKRKPDYDSAATYYSQAATCYKVAKDLQKAIDCFRKSAELFRQIDSLYNAAKQFEQAGFVANEAKNYQLTYEFIEKAADLMLLTGTRDSAGIILERAAAMIKLSDPANSLKLYKKAIHVADVEDKKREMTVFYEQAIGLAVKLNSLDEALELINQLMDVLQEIGTEEQIKKYVLSTVVIYLHRDDWVGAKAYLEKMEIRFDASRGGFGKIEDLLEAFDEKDDDRMKTIIKTYLTYAVDNELLKMVNNIIKSEEWIRESKAMQEQNTKKHASNMADSYHMPGSKKQAPVAPTTPTTTSNYDSTNTSNFDNEANPYEEQSVPESTAAVAATPAEDDDDEFDLK